MIRLTNYAGKPVYINPNNIQGIIPYDKPETQTRIYFAEEDCWAIKESPEEVARKVLEYRMAMERYKAAAYEDVRNGNSDAGLVWNLSEHEIYKLAGLEERT